MKTIGLFTITAVAIAFFSFQNDTKETKSLKHQDMLTIDKEHSTLGWKGGKSEAYFHTGIVSFSEGSLAMEHGTIVGGNFTVDLSTISVTDANLPKEKQASLAGHLQNEDFFNVTKFATATVKVGALKDGHLETTIHLMGVDIHQNLPVTVVTNDKGTAIHGKFDVDFSAAKIPGTQPVEGEKEHISPVFSFDLNLMMHAKH